MTDELRFPYYDYRDEKIDVFGDTALVRSTPVVPANYPPDQTIVRKYIKGHAQS
jgi:hypothetical protein